MSAPTLTKPPQKPAAPPYTMPRPEIGKVVLWYDDLGTENRPMPAYVMKTNEDSVDLNILVHGSPVMLVKDGVRYHRDPDQAKIKRLAAGCWDFVEAQGPDASSIARITELENQVTELKLRVDQLVAKK